MFGGDGGTCVESDGKLRRLWFFSEFAFGAVLLMDFSSGVRNFDKDHPSKKPKTENRM